MSIERVQAVRRQLAAATSEYERARALAQTTLTGIVGDGTGDPQVKAAADKVGSDFRIAVPLRPDVHAAPAVEDLGKAHGKGKK